MKILFLAQTPPPFHGQSIMQKYLVDEKWNWCVKKIIRLKYSKQHGEIGVFKFKKIIILLDIILKVWKERFKGKIDILYYPPTGSNKVAFYRDMITLILIRWCVKKIIFLFQAGGFSILHENLNLFEKFIAKKAYDNT